MKVHPRYAHLYTGEVAEILVSGERVRCSIAAKQSYTNALSCSVSDNRGGMSEHQFRFDEIEYVEVSGNRHVDDRTEVGVL